MTPQNPSWFTSWFDTPFYHILYKDRNKAEAQLFMNNLTRYLNLPPGGHILDLPCGRGRHSIYLNQLGYEVTGADLSANSIAYASQFANDSLHFTVHDMCQPFGKKFDAVLNLFTSFGYFEQEADNLKTIKAIHANLNDFGLAVIDFMNVDFVLENLVKEDVKLIDGIAFKQHRYYEAGYIIKNINFESDRKKYHFTERVRAFSLKDFEHLFESAGVYLLDIFGDYHLRKFDAQTSPRLIMVFK